MSKMSDTIQRNHGRAGQDLLGCMHADDDQRRFWDSRSIQTARHAAGRFIAINFEGYRGYQGYQSKSPAFLRLCIVAPGNPCSQCEGYRVTGPDQVTAVTLTPKGGLPKKAGISNW